MYRRTAPANCKLMTKAELLQQIDKVPDDYIICTTNPMNGMPYELNSVETFEEETTYYDINDRTKTGKIVQL